MRRWEPLAAIGLGLLATVVLSYAAALAWRGWSRGSAQRESAAAPHAAVSRGPATNPIPRG